MKLHLASHRLVLILDRTLPVTQIQDAPPASFQHAFTCQPALHTFLVHQPLKNIRGCEALEASSNTSVEKKIPQIFLIICIKVCGCYLFI